MDQDRKLEIALVTLRLSIFLVMFMWTVDKFLNVEHASGVYETFYSIGGLGPAALYAIGGIELLILLMFVAGYAKAYTYGAVLVFHAISTLSSFRQYLSPFDGPNLLFFAAWPMLAACFALFLLRDKDRLLSAG